MHEQLTGLWSYREMLFTTVKKDLRSRYRGSVLGFLWTFLNPLLQLAVYSIVFPFLLKVSEENYPLFIFTGLLPWICFSSSLQTATVCVPGNSSLIKKIYFPRIILPVGVVCTGFINLLFGLIIVLAALIFCRIPITSAILLLPAVLLVHFMFTLGLSCILAALYVYFRDLEHIVSIGIMAWFYLTPIVYDLSLFPPKYQFLLKLNPMTQTVMAYRDILFYGTLPEARGFLYLLAVSIVTLFVGVLLFSRLQKSFAEEL